MSATSTIVSLPWMGAEGLRDKRPFLVRARKVPDTLVATSELPNLFVITLAYESDHPTGLPSRQQYDMIGKFEGEAIDEIERRGIGALTFSRTWNGTVRYYCYVRHTQEAVDVINQRVPQDIPVELSAADDCDWSEYRRLIVSLRE